VICLKGKKRGKGKRERKEERGRKEKNTPFSQGNQHGNKKEA
jgi:hypothetical protein